MWTALPLPLLPSHSRLQGDGRTATPARASSARPPVCTSQEGGVSTTPCAVPCAQPLHPTFRMPHCACRPACGTMSVWHLKGGAQGSCTQNACGVVLTCHAEGAPPSLHAHAHSGVNPVARPHANGGRVPAALAACPLPSLHPGSLLEWAPPSPHPICVGREGAQGGRRRLQVAAHPPVRCYAHFGEQDAKGLCCARVCALLGRERGPRLYTNGGMIGGGGPCAQSSST